MKSLNFIELKHQVLNFLDSLKIQGTVCQYKFSKDSDATIFSTCFALFILDLFKETEKFSVQEKQKWISYIRGFQNKDQGYFKPEKYYCEDKERNRFQLTCFCLSALGILGVHPLYPLYFIDQWKKTEDITAYLLERGVHKGIGGSGNKAMFLAIFLIYEYERTGDKELLPRIDNWFEFHDKYVNKKTGFWGNGISHKYHDGMQNSFHQFVIYTYMQEREYPKYDIALDRILCLQDNDGFFAKTPGGYGCFDYDAIDYIVNLALKNGEKNSDVKNVLLKAQSAILSIKNEGGFPMMQKLELTWTNVIKKSPFVFGSFNPVLWYLNFRHLIRMKLNKTYQNNTYLTWTTKGCRPYASNLWDTWFRCLALAQIERFINVDGSRHFNFHKTIGIGYAPFD